MTVDYSLEAIRKDGEIISNISWCDMDLFVSGMEVSDIVLENMASWGVRTVTMDEEKDLKNEESLYDFVVREYPTLLQKTEKIAEYNKRFEAAEKEYKQSKALFLKMCLDNFKMTSEKINLVNNNDIYDLLAKIIASVNKDLGIIIAISLTDTDYDVDAMQAIHSLKTAYISIVIALALKMPMYHIVEVSCAAAFHELGMRRIPDSVYNKVGVLSKKELDLIQLHPTLGYKDLVNNNIKQEVALAVLEHHEREDGSGYPKGMTGDDISLYGKILALACSFEASTSKRAHRDTVKSGYSSIVSLLKTLGTQYDTNCLHALISVFSMVPLGSHVLLHGGYRGRVIGAYPETPRKADVEVLYDATGQKLLEPFVIYTPEKGLFSLEKVVSNDS